MERTFNVNYMQNLELQSLHYWFKHATSQNPSFKYSNVLNIMQDSIYEINAQDTIGTSIKYFTNSPQKHHTNFHDRVILRNALEHWKMYVIHKLHSRKAMYKANYFYHKKLQKKVLNVLSKNVLSKWKHIVSFTDSCTVKKDAVPANYVTAEIHYSNILLRRYFIYWCKYVTMRYKKNELLEKAIVFYDAYILTKSMIKWKKYVEKQRQKKIMQTKIDEANTFHIKSILHKCMRAWINVCNFTFQKIKMENAIVHSKNKLLKKYFLAWITYHNYKVQKLNTKEYIEEYSRKKVLKQYFEKFVMYVNESVANRIVLEKVINFYNVKLLQRFFFLWQEWYNKKVQKAIRMSEIRNILELRRKRTILITWRLYIFQKKCMRRKMLLAQSFYRKKLLIRFFRKLYRYSVYRKEKNEKLSYLNNKSEGIVQQLQRFYIEKWRKALYITMQEKHKLSKASKFWELSLIHKHFFYWKEFSKQYKLKSVHKEKLNELASSFFLKRFMQHWHSRLQEVLQIRKKEILATSIVKHKIMKKCLLSWKQYITQKVEVKNHIEVAKELHKKILLREGLKQVLKSSLCNIDYQYDAQLEGAAMRSFKNLEILKEYFDKWYSLIYLKNASRSAYKVATNTESQISCSNILDNIKNTHLVLPEYMKKPETISNVSDSFVTREYWSDKYFK